MAAGTELCPHCQRPFKRLRAHLPHCKAAPRAPAPAPGSAVGSAPTASPRPGRGTGTAPGSAPAPGSASGSAPAAALGSTRGSAPGPAPAANPRPAPGTGSAPGSAPAADLQPAPGTVSAPGSAPAADLRPAPGTGTAPGPAPAADLRPAPGTGTAPAQPPAPGRGPGPRSRSAAVQDVARSLDLHPEEVRDVPRRLRKGVQVAIEGHRARVLRRDPGTAAPPQRRKTAPKAKSKEAPSQGAVGSAAGSSKGEKSNLKAAKALGELPESGNSRGDLVRPEGRDKFAAGEEQAHVEFGVGSKPAVAVLHPEKLRLSVMEAFGGHGQGTCRNEPGSPQGLRDSGERGQAVPEPGLKLGTAPELGLLHAAKIQPRAGTRGLEWFPDLYPDYEALRIFPGKHFREDVRIAAETPEGGFTLGQQGPLSERPLMEVRLGELHSWIRTCSFSPQGLLGAVQRAWSSYCARYIHVKQGGPAGISMLLAGYCLFSYGWNYQHFKRHRWRKYH